MVAIGSKEGVRHKAGLALIAPPPIFAPLVVELSHLRPMQDTTVLKQMRH